MADFDYYQNCVHCGLCLPKCPTYAELGDENDSPRGRIYLMQAIDTGRLKPSRTIQHHLDLCLDCRACETVCPSGVEYGHLIESYRTHADGDQYRREGWRNRMTRWLTLNVFPYPQRTRLLIRAARLAPLACTAMPSLVQHLMNGGRASREIMASNENANLRRLRRHEQSGRLAIGSSPKLLARSRADV